MLCVSPNAQFVFVEEPLLDVDSLQIYTMRKKKDATGKCIEDVSWE